MFVIVDVSCLIPIGLKLPMNTVSDGSLYGMAYVAYYYYYC